MDRPTKHAGNAGDEPLLIFATIDGEKHMFTVEPGQSVDIPLDDDEYTDWQARAAASVTLEGGS